MKSILNFLVFSSLFLFACTPDSSPSKNNFQVKKRKGDESILMNRYLTEMVSNPISQDHKDRNLIVNMLIDSLWDFQKTYSGIYYQIETQGTGGKPSLDNEIVVQYRGMLLDGREFDSSLKRKKPMSFKLNAMIAGWQEFIPLLKKGGKGTFIVPSRLAYGPEPRSKTIIKPNSVLMFEIELVDFD